MKENKKLNNQSRWKRKTTKEEDPRHRWEEIQGSILHDCWINSSMDDWCHPLANAERNPLWKPAKRFSPHRAHLLLSSWHQTTVHLRMYHLHRWSLNTLFLTLPCNYSEGSWPSPSTPPPPRSPQPLIEVGRAVDPQSCDCGFEPHCRPVLQEM